MFHQYVFSSERSMHPQHLCGGMIFAQWQCHQQCWTLSDGTGVACTARYLRASFVSPGSSRWCCFHHSRGSWLKGSLCRHLYLWTSALAISRVTDSTAVTSTSLSSSSKMFSRHMILAGGSEISDSSAASVLTLGSWPKKKNLVTYNC